LRKSVIISSQDWEKKSGYFWPIETCQKLFYDEHAVVNHLSHVKSDINLSNYQELLLMLIKINNVAVLLMMFVKWQAGKIILK